MKTIKIIQNIILAEARLNFLTKYYVKGLNLISHCDYLIKNFLFKIFPLFNKSNKIPFRYSKAKIWLEKTLSKNDFDIIEIHPATVIKRKLPKTIDKEIHWNFRKEYKSKMSSTFVIGIKNGRVYGENGAIITPDGTLLDDVSIQLGSLPYGHKIFRKIRFPEIIRTNKVVAALATDGGNFYFHWIINVLPRIHLLNKSNLRVDKYLINYQNKPFQNESLKLLNIDLKKIIPSSNNLYLESSRLIVPSLVNNDPGQMPKWACDYLRESFLPHLNRIRKSNTKYSKYIYISRNKASGRKILNENEIFKNVLDKYKFSKIYLEDLSFIDQIKIFNDAEFIISPHGAGFANLVFCKPKTKIIEIFSPNFINPCYYLLSNIVDLDYFYLLGKSKKHHNNAELFGIRNNINVDLIMFKNLLELIEIS